MASNHYSLTKGVLTKLKTQKLFIDIPDNEILNSFTDIEELHILKNETVFRKGERYHRGIYFVLSGKVSLTNPQTKHKIICENEPVGLSTFLGKTTYTMDARAECDSDLIFITEISIYNLMAINTDFRMLLINDIQARLVDLRNSLAFRKRTAMSAVGSHMTSPVMTIQTSKTVLDAAEIMRTSSVESLLIVNRKQIIKGLITSATIIDKFMLNVRENLNELEVEKYGDSEPLFFPPELPLNEAATALQVNGKSHAIIMQGGKPAGIITKNDISLKLFKNYHLYTAYIEKFTTIAELTSTYKDVVNIAKSLSTTARVSRETLSTLSHIYHAIEKQAFFITMDEFKAKHNFDLCDYHYAYLVLGSSARDEMDLQPYINHAIVLDDDTDDNTYNMFVKFAQAFNNNLESIGYKFDLLDSNNGADLGLIKRMSEWLEFIDNWSAKEGDSDGYSCFTCIMDIAIFDGDVTSEWKIRNHLIKKVTDKPSTLRKILKLYPAIKIPISQFGSFITEKEGEFANMIDLHSNALSYLVNTTRLLSLHAGINDTNTVNRIEHLARKGIITKQMATNTIVAFDTIVETLLSEQISQHENGQPITTFIKPTTLSLAYQEKLKRALQFLMIYTSYGMNYLIDL